MSIIVGLHAGRYVMLAADHLYRLYSDSNQLMNDDPTRFQDYVGPSKIVQLPIGFLASCGATPLCDRVDQRLAESSPTSLDDVLQVILAERRTAAAWQPAMAEQAQRATRWILSFRGRLGDSIEDLVGLAIFSPDVAERWAVLTKPCIWVAMRPESDPLYRDWLEAERHTSTRAEDDVSSLEHNAELLRELLRRYAAEPNPKTTAECTLVAHFLDGERLQTTMLRPDDPLEWLDP